MKKFSISIKNAIYEHSIPETTLEWECLDTDMIKCSVREEIFNDFVKLIGEQGVVFSPSIFKDNRYNKERFMQMQLFVLCFDSALEENPEKQISFDVIMSRINKYDLPLLFAWDLFSNEYFDNNQIKRFCIAFLMDTPFTNYREANTALCALKFIFPEARNYENNVTHAYQGGCKLLCADQSIPTLNVEDLFMFMSCYAKDQYGQTNFKRKLIEFSEKTGLALNTRKLPDITVVENHSDINIDRKNNKNLPKTIIYNNNNGKFLSHHDTTDEQYVINYREDSSHEESSPKVQNSVRRTSYRSRDLNILNGTCALYNDFLSGTKLTHKELIGLASNIGKIESGSSTFKEVLKEKSYYLDDNKDDQWSFYFYYMKDRPVQPCKQFCPYHKTCPHGETILSTLKPEYHTIERVYNYDHPLVGLEEASKDFSNKFSEALNSPKGGWHVIKSQTSIGKTKAIMQLINEANVNVLVATPNNMLKQEEYRMAYKSFNQIAISPSLYEIQDELPEEVWKRIEKNLKTGKKTWALIGKILSEADPKKKKIRSREDFDESELYIKILWRYVSQELNFQKRPSGITTHMRLPSINLKKYDVVIVDEDFISSTIIPNRECIAISELMKLKKELEPLCPLAQKIKDILTKKNGRNYFKAKEISFDSDYDDIDIQINIRALCAAEYFYFQRFTDKDSEMSEDSIVLVNPIKFKGADKNTKFIMLSATANKSICEYCFGEDNVTFYECEEAAIRGQLNQYYEKPMSRSYLNDHLDIIDRIKKFTGVEHTITFKKFEKFCTTEMHFGNCMGSNILTGKDIDIIGTPHQTEWIYKLFAFSLGCNNIDDEIRPHTLVTHNGFRFRFTTYNNEILRNIQFYMIESDLEQAVGRARLLRHNCTVNLFSNFPLRQATLREANFDMPE